MTRLDLIEEAIKSLNKRLEKIETELKMSNKSETLKKEDNFIGFKEVKC